MSKQLRKLLSPWAIASLVGVWSLFFVACVSTERTIVAPTSIPGATYVGSKECASCHEEKAGKFAHASHASLAVTGTDGKEISSCEACHGPASLHVKAGDGKHIINPGKNPEACFKCHLDKRSQFSLPHAHQVLNGKMTCADCHDVHEGNAIKGSGGATLENENETCTVCHTAQKGPFVFKHQAMREGCTACHNPHGSVNQKMLLQRDSNLCVKCHLETPAAAGNGTLMIGGEDHRGRLNTGNCWLAGCHETVHGSNASKALRY